MKLAIELRTARIPGQEHPRDSNVISSTSSTRWPINGRRSSPHSAASCRALLARWLRQPTPSGDQYGLHHLTIGSRETEEQGRGDNFGRMRMTALVAETEMEAQGGCFCQVIYSQFGLAIHQNDHQARRRFVEWAQNEIAVVPDFHKRILLSDEAPFWLNGYVYKQNCRIWSEANPQVYVETPLHPEKLTVWCALWAGGILLQKR
ncbi:hypothetical protein TNCV_1598711 [Trichonephila clavipes]|nr:hypothetical protein TNCV_1598711 [Trichonephila clavipes]